MAKKSASRRRPTKKAATPARSITSSTTAKLPHNDPAPLAADQQDLFFNLLARGASPAAACMQLGFPYGAYLHSLAVLAGFRSRAAEVRRMLSENVAAALYRTAMEGSVPAQTFWLKSNPPDGWQADVNQPDLLERMSDYELVTLARACGIDLPPDCGTPAETSQPPFPGGVPSPPGD